MAKRKRASLKDKSPESLGLTQKKGKGIDLLFGGPSGQQESEAASQAAPETEEQGEAGSSAEDTSTTASTAAKDETAPDDERLVDELGLPVALEAPPEDLILASSSVDVTSGEEDAVDPATSPLAMPVAKGAEPGTATGDPNDLSGILDEDSLPIVEDDNLSSSLEEKDQSGLVENSAPSGPASTGSVSDDDLSGLVGDPSESDLSGLVIEEEPTSPEAGLTEDTATPATDLSELASEAAAAPATSTSTTPSTPPPASSPSSAPPPTTAAPINAPPSPAPEPAYQPASAPAPEPAAPAYTQPPAGSPALSAAPRPQEIGSIGGIVTEGTVSEEDILPEDALTETGDHIIPVEKRSELEQDDALTEKVMRYIGRERRERLDQQIESLYNRVADELSDHRDDAAFALKTLSEAQDIIIEDPRQYDEALYRVAVVKTMLVRKQNLRRWSYTWGMFVFFYAILWLVAFVAGFFIDVGSMGGGGQAVSEGAAAIRSAWISGLSGGIGGIVAILYSLSWRVAIKHEFDRQYIMKYLVQPFMGFLLGAVIFFITSAGFLILGGTSEATQFFGGDQLIFVQILLGFIAGFRQRVVYYMIDRIVQRLSPKPTESKQPSSVVPSEDYYALQGGPEEATSQ